MKLYDIYKKTQKLNEKKEEVPYDVWVVFGDQTKNMEVFGDQLCFGCDYVHLGQARNAIKWYVNQLGGVVVWEDK